MLRHTKGRWARTPFHLEAFQWEEILAPLFGWEVQDPEVDAWLRLYNIAWIELGRKNGKSELIAGAGLYLLSGDQEEGAEVYGAAKDTEQAGLVFRVAARMVELSPVLRATWRGQPRLRVYPRDKRIVDRKLESFYQVIAADAAGNLGQDPHGILFDEIIAQPSRELWDALETGMGSRGQPLMFALTTAGNDPSSFAAQEHEVCERVLKAPELDPRRFVYMRNTPVEADPWDESKWAWANPALGRFLRREVLRAESIRARTNPATELRFRQFRLNQWVRSRSKWIGLPAWDLTAGMVNEQALRGRKCYGGLDLSSTVDLTALCLHFPTWPSAEDPLGHHEAVWRHWLPEAKFAELDKRTGGQAALWVKEGFLSLTPGDVIDYGYVRNEVLGLTTRRGFVVAEVAYDPWQALQLAGELKESGVKMVPVRQQIANLSPAMKEWERAIVAKSYHHGGNPLARWQFDNITVVADPQGNIRIDKAKSGDKVDGCQAAVMALGRAFAHAPKKRKRGATWATMRGGA